MRRTALRLLPLCLAVSAAVHAQEAPKANWLLCRAPSTLPLFAELDAAGAERANAPTDIAEYGTR